MFFLRPMSRLLVIELHHLGDAVLSLPFLRAAQAAGHEVSVVCRPLASDIFAWVVPRERILTWEPPWHEESPKSSLPAAIKACRRLANEQIRPRGFDVAVCVWADPRVHWIMRMAGIPQRVGYPANATNFYAAEFGPRRRTLRLGQLAQSFLQCPPQEPLLTHKLEKASPHQHHFTSWCQLAEALAMPTPALPLAPPPAIAREPSLSCERQSGLPVVLAIAPMARLASKAWPLGNFAGVAERFLAEVPGSKVVWILPPGERGERVPAGGQIVRPESLDELCAVLAGCAVLLCNDSLPAHLASLVGTPVVSVFLTGNPSWFAPIGPNCRAVWKPAKLPVPRADADGNPSYVAREGPTTECVFEALKSVRQKE